MSSRPVFLVTLLVFAAAAFTPRTGQGYSLEGPKWANGSTVVMQLELGTPSQTLLDGNTSWNAAVAPALDAWNAVLQGMQFGSVMNSTAAVSSGDRVNTMSFANSVFGQSFGSNTLAVTYYSYSGSTMVEADILFNKAQTFNSYTGALNFSAGTDIQRVALHELGHALGLAHPDQNGQNVDAVMNSVVSNRYQLSADDIAGGQSLYGARSNPTPTPTPTPTATPTPTPTATPTPTPTATPTPTPTATPTPTPSTPSIHVSASPTSVRSNGTSTFTITASTTATSDLTVNYLMSGNAVLDQNYSLSGTPGQATIQAGSSSATVTLSVLTVGKKSKTAKMSLTLGTGYTLSTPTSASVSMRR